MDAVIKTQDHLTEAAVVAASDEPWMSLAAFHLPAKGLAWPWLVLDVPRSWLL